MIIAYKSVDNYRGNSIFTTDKKNILKNLQDYQQNIREIKINIVLPNTLKIIIDSYK
jgi:cell division septal protein FtsQ